jgi:Protein of unknown function (DUF1580)
MNDAENIMNETLITLSQAAKRMPPSRNGSPVSFNCILRWVKKGSRGPDGERVRLEAVKVGGRLLTSREALGRFAHRLTPQIADIPLSPTTRQRRRAMEQAEKELKKLGV